jgi:hypothetical protein
MIERNEAIRRLRRVVMEKSIGLRHLEKIARRSCLVAQDFDRGGTQAEVEEDLAPVLERSG